MKDKNFQIQVPPPVNPNLYCPTPNKLIGTFQYPRPKASSIERQSAYPNFMMSPLWHDRIMKTLNDKDPNSKVAQVYGQLFTSLPKPTNSMRENLKQINLKLAKRKGDRELKPVIFDSAHLEKYNMQILNPENRTSFFGTGSSLKRNQVANSENIFEKNLIESDGRTMTLDLKATDMGKSLQRLQAEKIAKDRPLVKFVDDFERDLERQLKEKKSIVV